MILSTAAAFLLCSCSSAVLPDPVQYAAFGEQDGAPDVGQAEIELKAAEDPYPSGPVFTADTETAAEAETEEASYSEGPSAPAEQPELPSDTPLPVREEDMTAPSDTAAEPVKTKVSESVPQIEETQRPVPSADPTPTPKARTTPTPAPEEKTENVPAVVREETETPKPVAETTLQPSPTEIPPTPSPTSEPPQISDYELAARVAYFESGSEDGRKAVLSVLFNRCSSSAFGGGKTDIRTEVYRRNQFSVVSRDDFLTAPIPSSLIGTAEQVFLDGGSVLPENVVFFRVASRGTEWGDKIYYDTIGGNCFFASAE